MPIPSKADEALVNVDNLHAVVLVKLRTWRHAQDNRDPGGVWRALEAYANAVTAFTEQF